MEQFYKMVQYSPEMCQIILVQPRHINSAEQDTENVQCTGARYLLDNPYLQSLCNGHSQNIFLHISNNTSI